MEAQDALYDLFTPGTGRAYDGGRGRQATGPLPARGNLGGEFARVSSGRVWRMGAGTRLAA